MSPIAESPVILSVEPAFALPGGEIILHGRALLASLTDPTLVFIGAAPATVVFASSTQLTVMVPDNVAENVPENVAENTGENVAENAPGNQQGTITVTTPAGTAETDFTVATLLAESLHPVSNPAVDANGNIYVTFSGTRGQSVPTSLFRIDDESLVHALAADVMNPTGLALDDGGNLYISSRHDGAVYRLSTSGDLSTYAEGMGVATGLAFDEIGNLYVGDRSGTIFKIAPDRQIFVFATLEPSVAAYHMAFSPNGKLYVTGPTTSSNDCVYEIDQNGIVTPFFAHLGRPQGLAFDLEGDLYVAASWRGRRGIIRITPERQASFIISGMNLVGLAFDPNNALIVATSSAAYFLPWSIPGFTLTPEIPEP